MLALGAVATVLALAFALTALVVGDRDQGSAVETTGPAETVAIELGDFYVEPDDIEVPAGTRLTISVTNKGDLAHDLNLDGETGTERLQPGETQAADLGVIDADAEAWCTVPGHKEAGMVLRIAVVEPLGPPGGKPPAGKPPATTAPGDGA
jgi:nitrite reductase (NO-forming)